MLAPLLWLLGWLFFSVVTVIVGTYAFKTTPGTDEILLVVAFAAFWPITVPFTLIGLVCWGVVRLLGVVRDAR